VILTLVCSTCRAQTIPERETDTGTDMLPHCKAFLVEERYSDTAGAKCFGILSTLGYIKQALIPRFRFCAPDELSGVQAGRVVIKFLEEHAEELHRDFRFLALAALRNQWPCVGGGTK
jgi:hypothetical protein